MKEANPHDYTRGATHLLAIALETHQSEEVPVRQGSIHKVQELVLLMQQHYQVASENTIQLLNEAASEEGIEWELMSLQDRLTEDDSLIVLFSGHSFFRDKIGESYWIPFDGTKGSISSCISSASLMIYLQTMKCRHLLLLTDACLPDTLVEHYEKLEVETGLLTRHIIAAGDAGFSSDPIVRNYFWDTIYNYFEDVRDTEVSVRLLCMRIENLKNHENLNRLFIFNHLNLDWLLRRTSEEDMFWKKVHEENTEAAFKRYVENFPDGKYRGAAHIMLAEYAIDRIWQKVLNKNTIEEYEDFLKLHSSTKYDDKARDRIDRLKEEMKNYSRGPKNTSGIQNFRRTTLESAAPQPGTSSRKDIVVRRKGASPPPPLPNESVRTRIKIGEKSPSNRTSIAKSGEEAANHILVSKAKGKSDNDRVSERFEAYPFISDPGILSRGNSFEVSVGFQEKLADEMLKQATKLAIESPDPDATIMIVLMTEGATIDKESQFQTMSLQMNSKVVFTGRVLPEAESVELHASYLYKGQLVGQATRHVAVIGGEPDSPDQVQFHSESIDILEYRAPVDLHVWVEYSPLKHSLTWVIQHEEITEEINLDRVNLDDNHKLALHLSEALERNQFHGEAAWRALENIGESIGQLIPEAFFKRLREIQKKKSAPPSILIITNEFYIPWELALHYSLELDSEFPPILNLQVELGRWLMSKFPRQELECNKLYYDVFEVVAANYHELQFQLSNAVIERDTLVKRFGAKAVEASKLELMSLVERLPNRGRILHMALHGHSGTKISENKLQLEDGDLMAVEWIPPKRPEDLPAISFLFLNACEVGSTSTVLSNIAGFPGLLLPKGIKGFIAPIWDVHDKEAMMWAELFYEQVIEKHATISHAMLQTRRKMQKERASLTCMAYLYYGHPGLQLEAVTEV
jgi:hypothetical protein